VGLRGKAGKSGKKKDLYAELCGSLSPEEFKKMEETGEELEVIEEKDWK